MRLIVHLGFHKTASTWLQHLLNDHHADLAERGIWYEPQPGYPAHHFAAWDLLLGDAGRFAAMLGNAAARGCHAVILSSEDLEAVVYNPQVADTIEAAALLHGVTAIEWHVALREPGAYFASLHAQLQHHVYADSVTMFTEVLRKGMLFVADPLPGERGTPYWCYCFDHHAALSDFAAATRHPVLVHDYADADPFPGWRLLDRLGALDAITRAPGAEGRNERLGRDAVTAGYRRRVADALGGALPDDVSAAVDACLAANLAAVPALSRAIGARFADSHRAALDEFSVAARSEVSPPPGNRAESR